MSTRTKSALVLVLLVLFINLPLVQGTWTRWRVDRSGTDVTATLLAHEVLGERDDPAYWISYRLPEDVDPDERAWPRQVAQAEYDEAVGSGEVTVRVLDGEPRTARVEGQVVGRAGLIATLVADALLLGFLWVLGRYGRYGRPSVLRMEAVGDVTVTSIDSGIEAADGLVTVSGTVGEITDHDVVLETAERRVVVVLDGHLVRVEAGRTGRVRGRWLR